MQLLPSEVHKWYIGAARLIPLVTINLFSGVFTNKTIKMSSSHGTGSSNLPGSSSGSAYGLSGVSARGNQMELSAALQGGSALMARLDTHCANSVRHPSL